MAVTQAKGLEKVESKAESSGETARVCIPTQASLPRKAKHIQMLKQIYKVTIYLLEARLFTIKSKIKSTLFLSSQPVFSHQPNMYELSGL